MDTSSSLTVPLTANEAAYLIGTPHALPFTSLENLPTTIGTIGIEKILRYCETVCVNIHLLPRTNTDTTTPPSHDAEEATNPPFNGNVLLGWRLLLRLTIYEPLKPKLLPFVPPALQIYQYCTTVTEQGILNHDTVPYYILADLVTEWLDMLTLSSSCTTIIPSILQSYPSFLSVFLRYILASETFLQHKLKHTLSVTLNGSNNSTITNPSIHRIIHRTLAITLLHRFIHYSKYAFDTVLPYVSSLARMVKLVHQHMDNDKEYAVAVVKLLGTIQRWMPKPNKRSVANGKNSTISDRQPVDDHHHHPYHHHHHASETLAVPPHRKDSDNSMHANVSRRPSESYHAYHAPTIPDSFVTNAVTRPDSTNSLHVYTSRRPSELDHHHSSSSPSRHDSKSSLHVHTSRRPSEHSHNSHDTHGRTAEEPHALSSTIPLVRHESSNSMFANVSRPPSANIHTSPDGSVLDYTSLTSNRTIPLARHESESSLHANASRRPSETSHTGIDADSEDENHHPSSVPFIPLARHESSSSMHANTSRRPSLSNHASPMDSVADYSEFSSSTNPNRAVPLARLESNNSMHANTSRRPSEVNYDTPMDSVIDYTEHGALPLGTIPLTRLESDNSMHANASRRPSETHQASPDSHAHSISPSSSVLHPFTDIDADHSVHEERTSNRGSISTDILHPPTFDSPQKSVSSPSQSPHARVSPSDTVSPVGNGTSEGKEEESKEKETEYIPGTNVLNDSELSQMNENDNGGHMDTSHVSAPEESDDSLVHGSGGILSEYLSMYNNQGDEEGNYENSTSYPNDDHYPSSTIVSDGTTGPEEYTSSFPYNPNIDYSTFHEKHTDEKDERKDDSDEPIHAPALSVEAPASEGKESEEI